MNDKFRNCRKKLAIPIDVIHHILYTLYSVKRYAEVTMVDAEKRLSQILAEIGNIAPAIFNERQQRFISGSIAKGYGYGGDKIVSEAFGIDPRTV